MIELRTLLIYSINIIMVVLLLIKPSGCSAMRPQAFMDTVFFTENSKGKRFDTTTHHVKGEFVKRARDFETTEGEIRMVNLNSICNKSDSYRHQQQRKHRLPKKSWIAFLETSPMTTVKSSSPSAAAGGGRARAIEVNCMTLADKIQHILNGDASGVLISDEYTIRKEQLELLQTEKPVVMMKSTKSKRLRSMISRGSTNYIRIRDKPIDTKGEGKQEVYENSEYFDMGIFLAFFIIVSLICLILLIKLKWRQNRKRHFRVKVAVEALKNMTIRKYVSRDQNIAIEVSEEETKNSFGIKTCTVCLEELDSGKDIRILPCRHEFHQECIDPWLIANFTCPLCMYSIIETKKLKYKSRSMFIPEFIARRFRTSARQQSAASDSSANTTISLDANTRRASILPAEFTEASTATVPATSYPHLYQCNQSFQRSGQESTHDSPSSQITPQIFRFHTCPFHNKRRTLSTTGNNINRNSGHIILEATGSPNKCGNFKVQSPANNEEEIPSCELNTTEYDSCIMKCSSKNRPCHHSSSINLNYKDVHRFRESTHETCSSYSKPGISSGTLQHNPRITYSGHVQQPDNYSRRKTSANYTPSFHSIVSLENDPEHTAGGELL